MKSAENKAAAIHKNQMRRVGHGWGNRVQGRAGKKASMFWGYAAWAGLSSISAGGLDKNTPAKTGVSEQGALRWPYATVLIQLCGSAARPNWMSHSFWRSFAVTSPT
ncbi:hypothetical protein GCM10022398_04860 [Acetobacter lovaniensis]